MSLPIKHYLVDATLERLGHSFKDLYNSKIGKDVREYLILLFAEEFIEPETGRQRNLKEIRSIYYKDKFKKTKRNWYSSLSKSLTKEAKNPKELMAEIRYIEDGIEKGFIDLETNYGVSSLDELKKIRLKEVEEWMNDDSKLLSEYKYIKDKTNNQILNTLKCDSVMTVANMVIDEYGGEFNSIVKEVSEIISEFPLPGKNGVTKFKDLTLDPDDTAVTAEEYHQGNIAVITKVGANLAEEKKTVSIMEKDYKIFNYVLSKRDLEFVKGQKIYVDIGDIVKNVYSSRGIKEYNQVRDRIEKMKHISFDIIDEDGKRHIFDLFDHVSYLDKAQTKAEIKINDYMHQSYIDNHVIKIYSDKIKNFSLSISENIVFILQKERFEKLSTYTDENEEEKHFIYDYRFFARRLRLPSRKKEALSIIDQSLKEILNSKVTIKSYKLVGEVFHISFIPVSEHEAEDLITSNSAKTIFEIEAPSSR